MLYLESDPADPKNIPEGLPPLQYGLVIVHNTYTYVSGETVGDKETAAQRAAELLALLRPTSSAGADDERELVAQES